MEMRAESLQGPPQALANAPGIGPRLALVTVGEAGPQVPSPGPQRETGTRKKLYLGPNEFCGLGASSCTSGSSFRGAGSSLVSLKAQAEDTKR